jgi:dTMP kinase
MNKSVSENSLLNAQTISVEGLDGAGKSTAITTLQEILEKKGKETLVIREPGGTAFSEILRAVLKRIDYPLCSDTEIQGVAESSINFLNDLLVQTSNSSLRAFSEYLLNITQQSAINNQQLNFPLVSGDISAEDELLLFNAARGQLIKQVVKPILKENRKTVILDRFIDSTIAYQGYGRGLDPDLVYKQCLIASDGILPQQTIYLRIDPQVRKQRIGSRGTEDRIEATGDQFFKRVSNGFDQLALNNKNRFRIIDANQSVSRVANDLRQLFS